jgi:hypothetical protein
VYQQQQQEQQHQDAENPFLDQRMKKKSAFLQMMHMMKYK